MTCTHQTFIVLTAFQTAKYQQYRQLSVSFRLPPLTADTLLIELLSAPEGGDIFYNAMAHIVRQSYEIAWHICA